ncbi:uncharacterized protein LOC143610821 [Bidens hawaiensis]|uniref:uncharacterized protein LOC143610821 n=1 Tax=Bidens hawaiensis TaxID=980011 RepID=UPI00404B3F08
MSDANQTGKETTSRSFQCSLLTKTHYMIWNMCMEVIFGIHRVWDVIDSGSNDSKKNNIVKALLFQSIPEEQILQIGSFKLGNEIWDAIKSRNMGTELTLGQPCEERKLVQKFFTSLPNWFIQVIASLEQVLDLKTVGFEDVVGRLKAYEERIKGHVLRSEEGKLLFNNSGSSSSSRQVSHESSRGCGNVSNRGRGNGRGGGHGYQNHGSQGGSNEGDKQRVKKDYLEVQCFHYDEFDHFVSRCPGRKKDKQANLADAKEKDPSLYMVQCVQGKVYLNEQKVIPKDYKGGLDEQDLWYLANGASNHMSVAKLNLEMCLMLIFEGNGRYC